MHKSNFLGIIASNFCLDYISQIVYCVFFGATSGSFLSLTPVILIDLIGMDSFIQAYGIQLLCFGLARIIGPPIIGNLMTWWENFFPHCFLHRCIPWCNWRPFCWILLCWHPYPDVWTHSLAPSMDWAFPEEKSLWSVAIKQGQVHISHLWTDTRSHTNPGTFPWPIISNA